MECRLFGTTAIELKFPASFEVDRVHQRQVRFLNERAVDYLRYLAVGPALDPLIDVFGGYCWLFVELEPFEAGGVILSNETLVRVAHAKLCIYEHTVSQTEGILALGDVQ